MTMIDTPEGIEFARWAAILSGLSLQARGLRVSRFKTPLTICLEQGITTKRTAKGALKEIALIIARNEDDPFRFGPVHTNMIKTLVDLNVTMTKGERNALGI